VLYNNSEPKSILIGLGGIQSLLSGLLLLSMFIASCGIPNFNPPPGTPSLRTIGTDILIDLEPTNLERTQGILILYKFYNGDSADDYAAEHALINTYINGNQAYSDLIARGYRIALTLGTVPDVPTFLFTDYPALFTDLVLEAGFESDLAGDYIIIQTVNFITQTGTGSLNIKIKNDTINLVRNDGAGNEIASFGNLIPSDPIASDQNDLPEIMPPVDVELNFAVFGYRSTFGEGITYSLPGILTVNDVISKFTLSL
jgi:hypothetical protein